MAGHSKMAKFAPADNDTGCAVRPVRRFDFLLQQRSMVGMVRKCIAALVLFPLVAQAEVSDKIWSVSGMWVAAIIIGAALALSSYWKWPFLFVALFVSTVMILGIQDMVDDKFMHEAVLAEQEAAYFIHGYLSGLLVTVLALLGIATKRFRVVRNHLASGGSKGPSGSGAP